MDADKTLDMHKLQVETWQFHVSYGGKLIVLYLAVVGGVVKFMLDGAATTQLFYALGLSGCLFTVWSDLVCRVHKKAVLRIGESIRASSPVQTSEKKGDEQVASYSRFLDLCMGFNIVVFAGFIVLLVMIDPATLAAPATPLS